MCYLVNPKLQDARAQARVNLDHFNGRTRARVVDSWNWEREDW
jgi:hypothetical protein